MHAASGIVSTAQDLSLWLQLQINNGEINGVPVIPADVLEKCHTGYIATVRDRIPFTGDASYGLGWYLGKYRNEKINYHFGGFPNYYSHISFLPDKKVGIAVLVNTGL